MPRSKWGCMGCSMFSASLNVFRKVTLNYSNLLKWCHRGNPRFIRKSTPRTPPKADNCTKNDTVPRAAEERKGRVGKGDLTFTGGAKMSKFQHGTPFFCFEMQSTSCTKAK